MSVKFKVEDLLEAGVHFGHQTHRWHPKMKPFIFTAKKNVHIIDLYKTEERLKEALAFLETLKKQGGSVLFVGTKRQAVPIIEKYAGIAKMPYVNKRWPGGLLTNFKTLGQRIEYFRKLDAESAGPELSGLTKKERLMQERKLARGKDLFAGVLQMTKVPEAIFVIDIIKEKIAVLEARRLGIPVIAIVDTNTDPELVTHPIPANDDALSSIELITKLVTEAIGGGVKKKVAKAEPKKVAKPKEAVKAKASKAESV